MDISRSTPKKAPTLKTVRRELRARRRLLSSHEQWLHAAALARVLGSDPRFRHARWIASYWPADGEMDPGPLLALAGRPGRRAFLPVLRPDRPSRLWFFPYAPGDPLRANRLGIPEPRRGRQVALPPWALDLILVPLVGFDADCNRLGMGGGYYDRTLAFLHRRRYWHRPRLIGLAHECQRVHRLEPRPWDVPLDAVATERRLYRRGRSRPPMGDQAISEKPLTPGIAGRPAKIR
jgi:5-formyltetrahydrofolate cyclo-ligase